MALVPTQHQNYMQDLFRTSSEDAANGVVASTRRERIQFFNAWTRWLSIYLPTLSNTLEECSLPYRLEILVAYGRHVRCGGVSNRKHQVRAQTVALAFRSISSTMQLDGKFNPLATAQGGYPKKIGQLLGNYKRLDPPVRPKLAIPALVPQHMHMLRCNKNPKEQTVGDFGLIAFYYLLRVGEYTYHKPSENRRTKQFRLQDVSLWHHNTLLSPALPIKYLLAHCTAATLNISNQKNGVRSQTIHQEAINTFSCPIRAIIRRVKHILHHTTNPNIILSTCFNKKYPIGRCITATLINTAVKQSTGYLGLEQHGLHKNHVGSHSLRAGGAMAMHLNGISDNTIKKMGRWSSDTFLMYIHEQISAFSKGISQKMSTNVQFHNIAFQPSHGPNLISPAA